LAGSGAGAANGSGAAAAFNQPAGVTVDLRNGLIYVAHLSNNLILVVTGAGVVSPLAGSSAGGADGSGINAQFNQPFGIVTDSNGNIFVGDGANSKIRKIR